MIIYPAIDIIDGKCVRLSKGDYSKKKIYSTDLENVAGDWIKNGSNYLHLVDLDGAKSVFLKHSIKIFIFCCAVFLSFFDSISFFSKNL